MPIDAEPDSNQAIDVEPLRWRIARHAQGESAGGRLEFLMRGRDAAADAWVTWTSSGAPLLTPTTTTPPAAGPITEPHVLLVRVT
jgi:hypothetical protein